MSIIDISSYKAEEKTVEEELLMENESIMTLRQILFLHLTPGIIMLAMIILFSQPFLIKLLGIDTDWVRYLVLLWDHLL